MLSKWNLERLCFLYALSKKWKAAIAILKKHPELLFKQGYVKCPAGLLYGSPYQIFLSAGDIWALNKVHQ
jgi:hypothetical protein